MDIVKGIFIGTISGIGAVDGEEIMLSLWRNPDTGALTALNLWDLPADHRFFYDPYTGQRVLVADTFSGLPK